MTCDICSTPLTGRQLKHCSPLCASRAFTAARKADGRARAYRKANAERISAYNAIYSAKWRATEAGMQMIRDGVARRRALLLGGETENFTYAEVFERDGWICGLCHEPVDPDLAHPDPMSKSLDHIVPLTRGGGHVRSNVQLAHLVCNVSKGNRAA